MTTTNHDIHEYALSLGIDLPPQADFWKLGDQTALRVSPDGSYYRSNYERGMLLYALVAHHRPKTVLEFGTGRGYGTLSMAWAMHAHNIDGMIYTVDRLTANTPIQWAIKETSTAEPHVEQLTWNAVWAEAVPEEWRQHITLLHGDSSSVMRESTLPPINIAFIDGGHSLDTVRHDFYTALASADTEFGILFDDYEETDKFGVRSLLADEVFPHFDAHLLQTRREYLDGTEKEAIYKMVWIHSESCDEPLDRIYATEKQQTFLQDYYRQQNPPAWQLALTLVKNRSYKFARRVWKKALSLSR